MEINRLQRKTLQGYQDLRRSQGTVWGQIRRRLWLYLVRIIGMIIVIPLIVMQNSGLVLLILGIILGMMARDIQYFFIWKRIWPVMETVLNWERIEALLDSA